MIPAGDDAFVLAVDLGTGGPKVAFVSLSGRIAWRERHAVETRLGPDGAAEQDPHEWWRLVVDAARRGLASGAVRREQVVAAAVTGQYASVVPVDAAGRPVGACVLWMDTRGGNAARRRFGGPVGGYRPRVLYQFVRRSGGAPSLDGADPIGHMLHLREAAPDVAAAARWYLEPVDYLTMRLTGVAAASPASMATWWLTDNRHLDTLEYDSVLVRLAGADIDTLPPLRPTASVIGPLGAAAAAELGLPGDVQVVAGIPDLHAAMAGSGAWDDFDAHLAISTTSWISCHVPFKKTDVMHQIAGIPGARRDRWAVIDSHDSSGLCLQWLRDAVLGADDGLLDVDAPELDALTELASRAPAGSGGVIFTPWLAGDRTPIDDKHARGGFHNVSMATTRADLVRSVLEGVAYNDRWMLECVERYAKRRLDPIRVLGGGAQSDLWCRIHADVMGRILERVADPLWAQVRGAALLAGLALGAVRADELRSLVPVDATFAPDPATTAVYERLYTEFPGLYKAQKGMFSRLNRAPA